MPLDDFFFRCFYAFALLFCFSLIFSSAAAIDILLRHYFIDAFVFFAFLRCRHAACCCFHVAAFLLRHYCYFFMPAFAASMFRFLFRHC